MSKVNIKIWDRDFEIEVEYYGQLEDEMTKQQKDSLNEFLESGKAVDNSLKELKSYVYQTSNGNLNNDDIDNIFRFVMPKYLYIPKKKDTIAIMCNYKFDMENGIAVVFEKGKLKCIGAEDVIL